jgi:2-keto-4-pentenoate hydratase/2-oxohepta-3-ene-1,7-dioic acid hydratase in catechol pathway
MPIVRFLDHKDAVRFGYSEKPVYSSSVPEELELITGEPPQDIARTQQFAGVKRILAPIIPAAILGVGANYRGLFEGTGRALPEYPIVFYKLANALQDPLGPVVLPREVVRAEEVKFEGELCVIIGRGGKNIPEANALDHVYGYTIANDVSAIDWQKERVGMQWAMGKGFDTFCPIGPAIATRDEISDPNRLRVVTRVDGKVEQDESVSELLFGIPRLISFLSAAHTIPDLSIVLTGTPPGARFLAPGETVEITIEPIGSLVNPVVGET